MGGRSPAGDRRAAVPDAAHLQIPRHLDLFQPRETPAFLLVADGLIAGHAMLGVWNVRVVRAVSVLFDGVRGAKDVKERRWRDGPEPVHVASRRREQDRRVARRRENIVHD